MFLMISNFIYEKKSFIDFSSSFLVSQQNLKMLFEEDYAAGQKSEKGSSVKNQKVENKTSLHCWFLEFMKNVVRVA
ncbi:CLUMA_CG006695, isoform A [Clunio marinus]|uniref:CLUMA_CG006695, isoform A n=1 Tax=Clunio marinus TaxID=568069 RepID=A0A1J1I266_9DIPT|nr:CLUMA_CG006695, isoform A [Clunio marinus]